MPPIFFGNDAVFADGRRRRVGINTSGGAGFREQFENRFQAGQTPFAESEEGSLLSLFSGVGRDSSGQIDPGSLDQNQRVFARQAALQGFFRPELSSQQVDAVGAVRKNRIARGLRGRAAEAAAESTAERFRSGNRRAALSFLASDLAGRGQERQTAFLDRFQRLGLEPSTGGGFRNAGFDSFIANAAAFSTLSRLRTQFAGQGPQNLDDRQRELLRSIEGGQLLTVGDQTFNLASGSGNLAAQRAVLGDDFQGQSDLISDFLGFQAFQQGLERSRAGLQQNEGLAGISSQGVAEGFLDNFFNQLDTQQFANRNPQSSEFAEGRALEQLFGPLAAPRNNLIGTSNEAFDIAVNSQMAGNLDSELAQLRANLFSPFSF